MPETEAKEALLAAYKRLLRPLVRLLLRNNIGFAEFSELSKELFVDVAIKDFGFSEKKMTNARIAIHTGLTKTEISKILEKYKTTRDDRSSSLTRVMKILSGWHTDPDFTGPYGLPLDLAYASPQGKSFSELSRRYTPEISPRSMLDYLIRIGVVKETDRGSYKILTRTYMPNADAPDSLERLACSVRNFIETIDYNRIEPNPEKRLFERTVVADDGIRIDDLPRFQTFLRERAQLLLEELDDWLSQLEKPASDSGVQVVQTGVGIYHYVDRDQSTV